MHPGPVAFDCLAPLRVGAADVDSALRGLAEQGLVDVFRPGSPDAVEFARRHLLVPLAFGLGPAPERPGLFAVGLWARPLAYLSKPVVDLWQWSPQVPNLWRGAWTSQ